MGINRELLLRKHNHIDSTAFPESMGPEEPVHHYLNISRCEKEMLDLIRSHNNGLTKGDLVAYTEYSRTKISCEIDSLLNKHYIHRNDERNWNAVLGARWYVSGARSAGPTPLDRPQ